MPRSIRFSRSCPDCDKPLQIPIELLGKKVQCLSCFCEFVASPVPEHGVKPVDEFDLKVEHLISAADRQLERYTLPVVTQ